MKQSWGERDPHRVLVSGLVVLLVMVSAAALFWYYRQNARVVSPTTRNDNTNAVDPVRSWPAYFSQSLGITVPMPPGMTVCDNGTDGFSVRTDACTASTVPSFLIRYRAEWNSMAVAAAFDDAFGQELKEAGVTSSAGHLTSVNGTVATVSQYAITDAVTGAIAYEQNVDESAARKIAITMSSSAPPKADGTSYTAQQIAALFLSHIVLRPGTGIVSTSPWTTFTDTAKAFSLDYPTGSVSYTPHPAAALSVTFGAKNARLEVRSGTSVDSVRPSLDGYRKITEIPVTIGSGTVTEERYLPIDAPGSTSRILFVAFTKGTKVVGLSMYTSGDPAEETQFGTILDTFKFL